MMSSNKDLDYFAEWNIADVVLKENEILINRPFSTSYGRKNAIIVQDEHGFKYRKYNPPTAGSKFESWKCSRINKGSSYLICALHHMVVHRDTVDSKNV